jgi:RNA polymerase sigma-70 factor (ECF subfamily)
MNRTSHNGQPSEIELAMVIEAFRQGDAQAFDILYAMYKARIYRFCLHMMSDDVLAKDAFQETFIRMYEHRTELRGQNVSSWLFTIARRSCLNQMRARRLNHDAFDETYHGAPVEDEIVDVYLREHIERALAMLPVALREALVLREYDGYSYGEIASIVGIDLSLAKVRVYRARLQMRKLLADVVEARR